LNNEEYNIVFFTDIGSGQLRLIEKHLKKKQVFILDHHEPELEQVKGVVQVNPHLFGIDGSHDMSGAGVVYFFVNALNPGIKGVAHLAFVGAIGDIQDENGFSEINKGIIEKAKDEGRIKVIKGLRVFGAQTKPLHKVLEYCSSPPIPGVSGSESGAIQFLREIGIMPKNANNEWRRLIDLGQEEIERLTEGIVMKILESDSSVNPEDIIGEVYIFKDEEKGSPMRDAKEFSTLLNACGRMGRSSYGIGACLDDPESKSKAIKTLNDYKREIVKAMEWFEKNKKSENVISEKGYLIINAKNFVRPSIIGTMASIISKSSEMEDGRLILSMAQNLDGNTKVSLRLAGSREREMDLNSVVSKIVERLGAGAAGGHSMASGAIIPSEKEEEFIVNARSVLQMFSMEERII
jgi:RecJ-like exonuclease